MSSLPRANGYDPTLDLTPNFEDMVAFVNTLFKHADSSGFVSFRIFRDNGKSEQPVKISAYQLKDYEFYELMVIDADQAARWPEPAVFAPPVCTFRISLAPRPIIFLRAPSLRWNATRRPTEARVTLEALLGPATIVVESGGEWISGETGEVEPKLHLHWRLAKPAATEEAIALLHRARRLATTLVGGDRTGDSDRAPAEMAGFMAPQGNAKAGADR